MTQQAAADTLRDSKLKVGPITTVSGAGKPGTVLDQDPKPGTKVEKEAVVALVLDQGRQQVTLTNGGGPTTSPGSSAADFISIPDVAGKTVDEAEAALAAVGLRAGKRHVETSSEPTGQVFKTSPVRDTRVAAGSPVELYVAIGSQVIVPDVKGKLQREAEQILRTAGLTIGTVSQVDETGPSGVVVRTNPASPAVILRGSPVEMFVRQELRVQKAGDMWGVNSSNQIYRWNGSGWEQIPGELMHVSIGTDGAVWGVNSSDEIYQWTGSGFRLSPTGRLKQIAVRTGTEMWGVNSSNGWEQIPGLSPTGRLKEIAVRTGTEMWGVNSSNQIYRWNGSGWEQIPGELKHVSVGADGAVWGVNSSDQIYQWTGSGFRLAPNGRLKQIAVRTGTNL